MRRKCGTRFKIIDKREVVDSDDIVWTMYELKCTCGTDHSTYFIQINKNFLPMLYVNSTINTDIAWVLVCIAKYLYLKPLRKGRIINAHKQDITTYKITEGGR